MPITKNSQRLAIIQAMINFPKATNDEMLRIVNTRFPQCTRSHIHTTMKKYGISKKRIKNMYIFDVPEQVAKVVECINESTKLVQKSKIDRVHTQEMTVYPGNCRITSL